VSPSHFLSTPTANRTLAHTRSFHLEAYARDDDLLDLEVLLEDKKPHPFLTLTRNFPTGVPIHLMALRLTVNKAMDVVAAEASMPRTPLPTVCPEAERSVERLIGLNLFKGFRKEVARVMPASDRCSHLSELAGLLPTLLIQSLMREQAEKELRGEGLDTRPAKIGGCHAWQEDSVAVKELYPQWYRNPQLEPDKAVETVRGKDMDISAMSSTKTKTN